MFSTEENQLIDEYFAFAKDLIKVAGQLVNEGYLKSNDDIGIVEKGAKWDMVTAYDKKTEDFLIGAIKEKYSDHKCAIFIKFIFIRDENVFFFPVLDSSPKSLKH